jgi:microsomal dipeptidase-like Zn-dependent dipeptidase
MSHPLHEKMVVIDGLQYSNWSRDVFKMMSEGGLTAVHATAAYWETTIEALRNIGDWNQRFQIHGDLIMPVRRVADIYAAKQADKVGIILGFQNCSPVEDDFRLVEIFHQLGVRFMQLTYNNQSLLASGCYENVDGGITRFGKVIIREMNRVGMVIDMSHSGERSTLEAIEFSSKPITVSHANPTFFQPAARNKSDTVLKAIGETKGMLGFSLYPLHLKNGSDCTLSEFCTMVARTAELIGVDHIGIGSDLCVDQPDSVLAWMRHGRWIKESGDGGSAALPAWPPQPEWIRSSADFGNLTQGLLDAGFDEADVAKIMGGNWLRFFKLSW